MVILYEIIATDDFIDIIKDLSLKHIGVLTSSFMSVKKIDNEQIEKDKHSFMGDLLEQIKNQELE